MQSLESKKLLAGRTAFTPTSRGPVQGGKIDEFPVVLARKHNKTCRTKHVAQNTVAHLDQCFASKNVKKNKREGKLEAIAVNAV